MMWAKTQIETWSRKMQRETEDWERRKKEAREKKIESIALNVSKVKGFPVEAIVDFICRCGTVKDFLAVRALSRSLKVPWPEFEGGIVVGNYDPFDFSSLSDASKICPKASAVELTNFGAYDKEERLHECFTSFSESLRLLNLDLVRTEENERIANAIWLGEPISPFSSAALFRNENVDSQMIPCLGFQNLQELTLDGKIGIQQFTLSSHLLQKIRIRSNKCIRFVGFANLPLLTTIDLYRCPYLKKMEVERTAARSLSSLHLSACQDLEVASIRKVLERTTSPLDDFVWTDMFRSMGDLNENLDLPELAAFLEVLPQYVRSFDVQRFSATLIERGSGHLKPMETIFDVALFHMLNSSHLHSASVRGSRLFTALPFPIGAHLKVLDVSSCKRMKEICVYESTLGESQSAPKDEIFSNEGEGVTENGTWGPEKLLIDNCLSLVNLEALSLFSCLRHLSCQRCNVTNDIFSLLPTCIEHLDLTGCENIGNFPDYFTLMCQYTSLRWCSFKMTSVTAPDVQKFLLTARNIEYFNLGNLELNSFTIKSNSLKRLLLLNVDVSERFSIVCPLLEELWIGNRFRGWPYNKPDRFRRWPYNKPDCPAGIHATSLAKCLFIACENKNDSRHVHVRLPEELTLLSEAEQAQNLRFVIENFWDCGDRPSNFNGLAYEEIWKEDEARQANVDVKNALVQTLPSLEPMSRKFTVTIVKGPSIRILAPPKMTPNPPDAKIFRDYSEVGLGTDGGYVSQMESEWY